MRRSWAWHLNEQRCWTTFGLQRCTTTEREERHITNCLFGKGIDERVIPTVGDVVEVLDAAPVTLIGETQTKRPTSKNALPVTVMTEGSKSKKVPELCHRRLPSTPEKVLLDFRKG